jgi:hypothetical protein
MASNFDSLRNAANERLIVRNVFDIDAYRWTNADDVDPDSIGFAMWTTSPPYDHDLRAGRETLGPIRFLNWKVPPAVTSDDNEAAAMKAMTKLTTTSPKKTHDGRFKMADFDRSVPLRGPACGPY